MSLGALGYVGYGVETTEGVGVTPTKFLPVSAFSFEDTNDFQTPDQIRHSRDRYIAMESPYAVSGSMDMELIPNDIGSLLRSALSCEVADVDSSPYSGGGYEHVIYPGSAQPTLTFEGSAADILVMRYAGVRVNTLELKAAFGEIVTASFGLEGLSRDKQSSATSISESNFTDVDPFNFSGVDIHVASGTLLTHVKDFTFGINNNLERIGTLRKTRTWKRMAIGMREVTLSMTLDFTDTSEYDRFLAEDWFDTDLFIQGTAGQSGMGTNRPMLRIQVPKVRYNKVGVPLSAGDYLEQSVEALIVKAIGSDICTLTLVNTESSIE